MMAGNLQTTLCATFFRRQMIGYVLVCMGYYSAPIGPEIALVLLMLAWSLTTLGGPCRSTTSLNHLLALEQSS